MMNIKYKNFLRCCRMQKSKIIRPAFLLSINLFLFGFPSYLRVENGNFYCLSARIIRGDIDWAEVRERYSNLGFDYNPYTTCLKSIGLGELSEKLGINPELVLYRLWEEDWIELLNSFSSLIPPSDGILKIIKYLTEDRYKVFSEEEVLNILTSSEKYKKLLELITHYGLWELAQNLSENYYEKYFKKKKDHTPLLLQGYFIDLLQASLNETKQATENIARGFRLAVKLGREIGDRDPLKFIESARILYQQIIPHITELLKDRPEIFILAIQTAIELARENRDWRRFLTVELPELIRTAESEEEIQEGIDFILSSQEL